MFEVCKNDIDAFLKRDPAARNQLEVLFFYPGLHALWLHRCAHSLWQADMKSLARALAAFSRFLTGIEIHPAARIGQRLVMDHGAGIVIGETAEIGDDVLMYHGATLGGSANSPIKRHPTIGDRVVLGAGCKVIGDIVVGNDARIGINAVITRDVDAFAVMVAPHAVLLNSVLPETANAAVAASAAAAAAAASYISAQ